MPSIIQSAFAAGDWAPEYHGRTDLPGYRQACASSSSNMVVLPQGSGRTRRPGFHHVALAKNNNADKIRLHRFSPAAGVHLILEFGPAYIRLFRNRVPVLFSGSPFEIATPYAAVDLDGLSFTQDGAALTIWSVGHAPRVLTWKGADASWDFVIVAYTDGPYLDPVKGVSVTPAAASASTTITASAVTGINGNNGFLASDVERHIRFKQKCLGLTDIAAPPLAVPGAGYAVGDTITVAGGTYFRPAVLTVTELVSTSGDVKAVQISDHGAYLVAPASPIIPAKTSGTGSGVSVGVSFAQDQDQDDCWIWGTITARSSPTIVTVAIQNIVTNAEGDTLAGQFISTAALTTWRLGAWCEWEGYPSAAGRFQRRHLAGATTRQPKRLWGSETDALTSFAPSLGTGQVIDSNGLDLTLDDARTDPILWLARAGGAERPQIAIGAGDGQFILQPGSAGAVTPTAFELFAETDYKSTGRATEPLRIGRFLIFADGGILLRQWAYAFQAGGFVGPEIAPYARHLMRGGIEQIARAALPYQILWWQCADGTLAGLTYDPDEGIAAAHSHRLGGFYYGAAPRVESLAICPDELGDDDQLWVVVLRSDNASVTRSIEVSTPYFRGDPLSKAVFMDAALWSPLTYPNATCTPAGITLPVRGDSINVGFSADVAFAADLSPGTVLRLNNGLFRLTGVRGPRSIICECMDPPDSLEPQLSGAWSYTRMASSFSGFDLHNGRTVSIIGDGALYPPQVFSNGTVRLDPPASQVTLGLLAAAQIETLDLDLPAADGTSQMKTGRLDHLYLRVLETAGGSYGPDLDHLDRIEPRDTADLMDWAPPLISDDLRVAFPGGSSERRRVIVRQDDPWPLTVLALVVKGGTTETAPK